MNEPALKSGDLVQRRDGDERNPIHRVHAAWLDGTGETLFVVPEAPFPMAEMVAIDALAGAPTWRFDDAAHQVVKELRAHGLIGDAP